MVQWSRICLPMQGTCVQSQVGEDPTCQGAAKPVAASTEARAPEPVLHKRSPTVRSPHAATREQPPLAAMTESLGAAVNTPCSQKSISKSPVEVPLW